MKLAILGPWGPVLIGSWKFASSHLGSVILASTICYGAGYYTASTANDEELARETEATKSLAAAAVARAEEDTALINYLNKKLEKSPSSNTATVPWLSSIRAHAPSVSLLDHARPVRVNKTAHH